MTFSKLTREFFRDWLDWVEQGAPNNAPYSRHWGLCSNSDVFDSSRFVYNELVDYFGFGETPFGDDYISRANDATQHQCPNRLAFVRANLPETDAPSTALWRELWSCISPASCEILLNPAHASTNFFEGFLIGKFGNAHSTVSLYNAAHAGKILLHGGE